VAKTMTVQKVESLTEAVIEANLKIMQDKQVVIPSTLKAKLWLVRVNNLMDHARSGVELAVKSIVTLCTPWTTSVCEDVVLSSLVLGDLEASSSEKRAKSLNIMAVRLLLPVVLQGEPGASTVHSICTTSLAFFDVDSVPDDPEWEGLACDVMTLWRCFAGLLTPANLDSSLSDDVAEVKGHRGSSGLALFRDAFENIPFWAKTLSEFDATKEFHRTFGQEIMQTTALLAGCLPSDAVSAKVFQDKCKLLAKWQVKLRPGACDAVSLVVKTAMLTWIEEIDVSTAALDVLAEQLKMLEVVGPVHVAIQSYYCESMGPNFQNMIWCFVII
jgi:hypothetical protein